MATPNYGYEKRQRELAKKQKKQDKLRAKAANARHSSDQAPSEHGADEAVPTPTETPGTEGQTA